ncbi:MAG: hypothetical protein H0W56_07540 [Acidothermales bacterium]|nr:hypothetical protein [Acidothermales bacterium]
MHPAPEPAAGSAQHPAVGSAQHPAAGSRRRSTTRTTEALAALAALAAEQDAVVTRAQLAALGYDRHRIRDHVRAARWRLVGKHVVVLHRGPRSERQRWWTAVLNLGQCAALAGLTAAAAGGLTGFVSESVHVVVPRGARIHPLPGVTVHESRRFSRADIHPSSAPPSVRVERALVDAAVWSSSPRRACAIIAAGVQQRLTTVGRLRRELLRAGAVRHRRLLTGLLDDIAGGAQALSEIDFARLCRRGRLPAPTRQAVRRDSRGRRRYLDVEWRLNGKVFVVEVDGGVHLVAAQSWEDQLRQNELVLKGDTVLRYPSVIIRTEPQLVLDQLRSLLLPGTCQAIRAL